MRDAEETLCIVGVMCVQRVTCLFCDGYNSDEQRYMKYGCDLTEVPRDIPAQARRVYLGDNAISHIRDGAFRHLTRCTVLSLGNNALREVRAGMWEGLSSLTELTLGFNQIRTIGVGAFNTLTSLARLWLYHNQLVTLEERWFSTPLRTNLTLDLGENPFQCDAGMCWLMEAERVGHITWDTWSGDGRPQCENQPDVHWDNINLNCTEPGQS